MNCGEAHTCYHQSLNKLLLHNYWLEAQMAMLLRGNFENHLRFIKLLTQCKLFSQKTTLEGMINFFKSSVHVSNKLFDWIYL